MQTVVWSVPTERLDYFSQPYHTISSLPVLSPRVWRRCDTLNHLHRGKPLGVTENLPLASLFLF